MHAIHHTEAFVLKSTHAGEANKRLWLFTREFGLIVATVQGVRKSGAKLQAHIADYSIIAADLVKGKEVWRLISAQTIDNPVSGKTRDPLSRAYVRSLSFLIRFLRGEDTNDELFDHMKDIATVLRGGSYDAKTVDAISLWKILALLGYIAPTAQTSYALEKHLNESIAETSDAIRARMVAEAKQAITESHL